VLCSRGGKSKGLKGGEGLSSAEDLVTLEEDLAPRQPVAKQMDIMVMAGIDEEEEHDQLNITAQARPGNPTPNPNQQINK